MFLKKSALNLYFFPVNVSCSAIIAIPEPHHLLPDLNPDWFYLSGTSLPRLFWKSGC